MENCDSWKHEGKSWYLLRYGQISFQKMHSQLENSGLEFFLPSYTAVENRKKGVQVPFPDAIIATIALKNDIPIWTGDQHFKLIQKVFSKLKLYYAE